MDQLIQQTLLVQAGPDEVSQRVALSLDNEERALRAAEQAQSAMDEAVTEAALTDAYAEAYEGENRGMEFNASHILVETEEKAAALAERAREGEDFAELAKENSTGPSRPQWRRAGLVRCRHDGCRIRGGGAGAGRRRDLRSGADPVRLARDQAQ